MPISPAGMASLLRAVPSTPRSAEGPPPPSAGAAGPGGPGGPGAPGGPEGMGGSDIFNAVVSRTMSDAGSADPSYILDQLRQMKTIAANMLPKTALRFSGVAKHIANVYRGLDAALSEAEKAQQSFAAQSPINFSGANAAPGGAPMPPQNGP